MIHLIAGIHMGHTAQLDPPTPLQKTVLVVGCDAALAGRMSAILPDWSLERASDNVMASTQAESKRFDLVITGAATSGKADVDLLRKIRLVHPDTRVIIITGQSTPADVIASMREEAFSYFSEPVSWETFADMVRLASQQPWGDGIEILSATPSWIRIAVRCDVSTADRVLQFFHEIVELPEDEVHRIGTALREMLLNAMEYGGEFDLNEYVEVAYLHANHMAICRVKDPGKGFSLNEIRHAAVANPPDDPIEHLAHREAQGLRPGGFGVLLAKHLVDELVYNEKGNDVLLIRYLDNTVARSA